MRDPVGDRNILYLDCINIKILVVISYYSFARSCPGELRKYKALLLYVRKNTMYYFLQMHANLQLSQNRKFN